MKHTQTIEALAEASIKNTNNTTANMEMAFVWYFVEPSRHVYKNETNFDNKPPKIAAEVKKKWKLN